MVERKGYGLHLYGCLMTSKKTAAQKKRAKPPRNSDRTKQFGKD